MKDLKDLVKIALSGRIGKIETLTSLEEGDESNLLFQLFKALAEDKVDSDEEAMALIYGEEVDTSKYKMLKLRFKERLFNTLLYVEPRNKDKKSYFHNVYYCYKHLVIARLLMGISPSGEGRRIMEKVHNKAEKFELFDIVQQSAQALRREYMLKGDESRFRYFVKSFENSYQTLVAESKAEVLHDEVIIHLTRSVGKKSELAALAERNMEEMQTIRSQYDTYNITYFGYNLEVLLLQLKGDYNKALQVNQNYESYFLKKKAFYSGIRHANILTVRVSCCLHLRKYEEGQIYASQVLGKYNSGSENWFTVQEMHFLIVLNSGNMEKACEVYLEVINHPRFPVIRSIKQEIWKLYGGYLWFMLKFKEEEALLRNTFPQMERFSLGKFMNDLPASFAKDKTGYNVALLILQVLILLERREEVSIISRTDALKAYHYNNLKDPEAKRSFWFIKLLMLLDRHNFDPRLLRTKAKTYLSKFQDETVGYEATPMRIEIIPYEAIWEIILQMMERQQVGQKALVK